MYFSTAVIAAFAATYVSAAPLAVRSNTCGAAPAGSSKNQPISKPSGIETTLACQVECESDDSCKSFCFGMVDLVIQCELYSCAASEVPAQLSLDLVVYDQACSAVPSVVPTSSNPTGKKTDNSQSNSGSSSSYGSKSSSSSKSNDQQTSDSKKSDSSKTSGQAATQSKQAQASTGNSYGSSKQTTNSNNSQKSSSSSDASSSDSQKSSSSSDSSKSSSSGSQMSSGSQKSSDSEKSSDTSKKSSSNSSQKSSSSSSDTCGAQPTASTDCEPIATPTVTLEVDCQSACEDDSSCKSFTCGSVDNALVCQLYAVVALEVPVPTTSAMKNAMKAYDVGCSM